MLLLSAPRRCWKQVYHFGNNFRVCFRKGWLCWENSTLHVMSFDSHKEFHNLRVESPRVFNSINAISLRRKWDQSNIWHFLDMLMIIIIGYTQISPSSHNYAYFIWISLIVQVVSIHCKLSTASYFLKFLLFSYVHRLRCYVFWRGLVTFEITRLSPGIFH